MIKVHFVLSFLCLVLSIDRSLAQVRLPRIISDSMVIQRDSKLKVWGWASGGEKVVVTFRGRNFNTKAGVDGKWFIWLPPLKAGGPYEMNISARNEISIKNILVGDVWFCSGQSNMVHYLELHKERYEDEIRKANYPAIRQFLVPTQTDLTGPKDNFPQGNWKTATRENINRFSVVAYFFAKKLYEKYNVPIGIINVSVGGTPIEAWTSEDGLKEFPGFLKTVERNKDTAYVNDLVRAAMVIQQKNAAKKPVDEGLTGERPWYDTTYIPNNWRGISIPGYWEDQGIKELDGVVWYRREIDLPSAFNGAPGKIALGRIVDADFVYINGTLVGKTGYQYPQRRYTIPAGVLKAGKNVLVIRVLNNGGKGGFVPDKPYYISANGQTIDLVGYWYYKVGEVYPPEKRTTGGISLQNQPTALFNGMVAPVTDHVIRGIVWYQGESNATRAKEYKRLLPAMITDWRKQWRQEDLPFLYVQLPNFMEANYLPAESEWAELREAQLHALTINKTAMAVAIDLGEWNDIHPGNKRPIGERLALAARHVAYGEKNIVHSGPIYESYKIEGNKIIIYFKDAGSGLVSIDGDELRHFAIAGKDKNFIWAKTRILNNTIEVWSDTIPEPYFVRYAWADNPVDANLSNKEGLPASPFRTDE